ncbi:efflux RND transporter periplasmic adaptor subunit [Vibrio sp. RC27]
MRNAYLATAVTLSMMGVSLTSSAEQLFTVSRDSIPNLIQFDGVVEAVNQGTVAAQTNGRIVGINVDVNDRVKKGDVLLEISAAQQSASLDAAQAQLSSANAQNRDAQSQVKRYRLLFPKGAISREQMDSAEARANSSEAEVKSAQANVTKAKDALGYTRIKAPYDGVVTERFVELGETVAPGSPLFSGYGVSQLRVKTHVPQYYQSQVNDVSQFQVHSPSGASLTPTSYNLFSYADPQTHTFTIRLELSQEANDLLPGMWVKTDFNYGVHSALVVPKEAVIRRGELSSVYRWEDEHSVLNPVRLGQVYEGYIEILSGLEVGDQVVSKAVTLEGK